MKHMLQATTAAIAALFIASGAMAQDTTETEAPAAETGSTPATPPAGDPAAAESRIQVKSTHGDWQVLCAPDESDCYMYQVALNYRNQPVADFNIVRIEDDTPAKAGVTVLTPLGTLLTAGLVMQVDDNDPRQFPFVWCDGAGCFSRFAFDEEFLNDLKAGQQGLVSLRSMSNPAQEIILNLSLDGFTAAFNELEPLSNASQQQPQQ